MFNAVRVSKSLYSLETLQPTETTAVKLNTFQLKGVKQTLNMSTTYIDRTNTNQKNYRRANLEMGKGKHGFTRPLRDIFTGQTKEIVGPWHQKKLDITRNTKQRLQ